MSASRSPLQQPRRINGEVNLLRDPRSFRNGRRIASAATQPLGYGPLGNSARRIRTFACTVATPRGDAARNVT
jgi:hypothetical protein